MKIFRWLSDFFNPAPAGVHTNSRTGSHFHEFEGGQLTYRPDLIRQLKREHRLLEAAYGGLLEAHAKGDYDTCVSKLRGFTTILRAHLLKENTLLYVYLRKVLEHDSESSALMNAMRMEMQGIGKVLNSFATEYTSSPWDAEKRVQLGNDLEKIHQALGARIESEESVLYTLYLPQSAYLDAGAHENRRVQPFVG